MSRKVPLTVIDIGDENIAELYERRLVMVRPDGHVGWRADTPPDNPHAVTDTLRGA
jgi:aromatic ring hydroxylase-like protein